MTQGGRRNIDESRSKNSSTEHYVHSNHEEFKLPVSHVSSSDFSMVNSWFSDNVILSLMPPYTTDVSTVLFTSRSQPFTRFQEDDHTKRYGIITLESVS